MLDVLLWPALAHVLPALLLAAMGGTVSVSDSQKLSTCDAVNAMDTQAALWEMCMDKLLLLSTAVHLRRPCAAVAGVTENHRCTLVQS
jgi:hypothetical protein